MKLRDEEGDNEIRIFENLIRKLFD